MVDLESKWKEAFPRVCSNIYCGVCGIPDSWVPHIELALARLEATGLDVSVAQVKEKYGILRLYLDYGPMLKEDERHILDDIVILASSACYGMCHNCGSKDDIKYHGKGWVLRVCAACRVDAP